MSRAPNGDPDTIVPAPSPRKQPPHARPDKPSDGAVAPERIDRILSAQVVPGLTVVECFRIFDEATCEEMVAAILKADAATPPDTQAGTVESYQFAASSPPLPSHQNASYRGAEIDLCEVAACLERAHAMVAAQFVDDEEMVQQLIAMASKVVRLGAKT